MAKDEILEQIREGRGALLTAIEGLSDDAMLRTHVVGFWSVKDVLAHLTAWESELITALSRVDQPDVEPTIVQIDDLDEWNDEQYRNAVRRPLADVLRDFNGVHKYLLQAVADLDEATLEDNSRFEWMEGEPLSYLISENAVWHEQEHAEQIREWRAANDLPLP